MINIIRSLGACLPVFATLLFASVSSAQVLPATTDLVQSSRLAHEAFAQNYLTATGRVLGAEFVGMTVKPDATTGEHVAQVWIADSATSIVGQEMRCGASCAVGVGLPSQTYTHGPRRVTGLVLQESFEGASEEFAKRVAPLAQMTSVKLWVRGAYVYFRIEWDKAGVAQTSFMGCHQHGSHVDCHRSTRPGAGEF